MSAYLRVRGQNLITEGSAATNGPPATSNLASTSAEPVAVNNQVDPSPATINSSILNPIAFIQVIFFLKLIKYFLRI